MSDHLDKLAIDTIRTLSMDAVQKANSGHPGTPMALAPLMYTLWQNHLRYDPANPFNALHAQAVQTAGQARGLTVQLWEVRGKDDFERVFAALRAR